MCCVVLCCVVMCCVVLCCVVLLLNLALYTAKCLLFFLLQLCTGLTGVDISMVVYGQEEESKTIIIRKILKEDSVPETWQDTYEEVRNILCIYIYIYIYIYIWFCISLKTHMKLVCNL